VSCHKATLHPKKAYRGAPGLTWPLPVVIIAVIVVIRLWLFRLRRDRLRLRFGCCVRVAALVSSTGVVITAFHNAHQACSQIPR